MQCNLEQILRPLGFILSGFIIGPPADEVGLGLLADITELGTVSVVIELNPHADYLEAIKDAPAP